MLICWSACPFLLKWNTCLEIFWWIILLPTPHPPHFLFVPGLTWCINFSVCLSIFPCILSPSHWHAFSCFYLKLNGFRFGSPMVVQTRRLLFLLWWNLERERIFPCMCTCRKAVEQLPNGLTKWKFCPDIKQWHKGHFTCMWVADNFLREVMLHSEPQNGFRQFKIILSGVSIFGIVWLRATTCMVRILWQ